MSDESTGLDVSTLIDYWQRFYSVIRQALGDRVDPDTERLLPFMVILAFLLVVYLPIAFLIGSIRTERKEKAKDKTKEANHLATSRFESFLQWVAPPKDPWTVGQIVVSLQWLTHCIIFGTTGSGKSTFVRARILRPHVGLPALIIGFIWLLNGHRWFAREKRGALVFAGNESLPFRKALFELMEAGYPAHIWTSDPSGKGFGLDVWEGPPRNVAQRINAMKPAGPGDTGLRSGAVEGMIADTIFELDRRKKSRDFDNLLSTIKTIGIRDLDENGEPTGEPRELTRQEAAGLEDWCTRLGTMRQRLGKSIGPDLKLSEALKRGEVVLVQASSYGQPAATEQLATMIVYYAMWLVSVIGNFDLIIDEPGAVDPKMFTRLLTATRAQGVKIMICPQSLKQIEPELREMCTTSLLLGAASASHEAQELCSKMVHGDIEPIDFTLLNPRSWRDGWRKRRGLRSCQGYLMSNGRLDLVKTPHCDVSALNRGHKKYDPKRYPIGSVSPLIAAQKVTILQDRPAPTCPILESPENAQSEIGEIGPDAGVDEAVDASESNDVGKDVVDGLAVSDASTSVFCPEVALALPDGRRIWGKGVAAESRTPGLEKAHRFWTGGNNGTPAARPKTQAKQLFGLDKGKRATVTVYIWWYELISGKPVPPVRPTIDHVCHTLDDSCPGPNPCMLVGCDDEAHPEGEVCQHTRCYEYSHLEPVTLKENARRQSQQKARHAQWLNNQSKIAA